MVGRFAQVGRNIYHVCHLEFSVHNDNKKQTVSYSLLLCFLNML